MKRKVLSNEIVNFCLEYGVFNITTNISDIKTRIEHQLEDYDFVESLINMIITKTKEQENIDIERLKRLLLELEKVRLELEYRKHKRN